MIAYNTICFFDESGKRISIKQIFEENINDLSKVYKTG